MTALPLPANATPASSAERPGPYQLFMLVLCALTLVVLGVSISVPLEPETRTLLEHMDTAACALFFADFLHSLWTAPDRLRYLRTWGWIDLLSSIPVVGPLRLGRFARVVRILRVIRAVKSARAIAALLIARRRQSALLAAALLALLLVTCASVAILELEAGTEGNIRTAGDAFWWSITTMSTVGYGDRYPVTTEGRIVAVFLMAGGVGIFGTLSGLLAAWFLAPEQDAKEAKLEEIRATLDELRRRLPPER